MHVLNDVRRVGNGINNAVVDLACEQVRLGHRVMIVSAGGEYEPLLTEHGVEHHAVPDIRRPSAALFTSRELRRLVLRQGVDVVHAHMNYSTLIARLATLATPASLVATAHTAFKRDAVLMALADRLIAVGTAVGESMRRKGVPAARIRIVRNGTIGSPRLTSTAEPAQLEHPAVTCVAGMYRRKGIDVLVQAFHLVADAIPDAHLYLVGDGPDRTDFEALAAAGPAASRIHFTGFRDDVRAVLAATDIFVLPSRRDPFPLVLLEAREAGCAVVASTADGMPEACDWGRAGWLFPVDDVQALAFALRTLNQDGEALRHWRDAARVGLDDYTVARVAAQVDAVYEELLTP